MGSCFSERKMQKWLASKICLHLCQLLNQYEARLFKGGGPVEKIRIINILIIIFKWFQIMLECRLTCHHLHVRWPSLYGEGAIFWNPRSFNTCYQAPYSLRMLVKCDLNFLKYQTDISAKHHCLHSPSTPHASVRGFWYLDDFWNNCNILQLAEDAGIATIMRNQSPDPRRCLLQDEESDSGRHACLSVNKGECTTRYAALT